MENTIATGAPITTLIALGVMEQCGLNDWYFDVQDTVDPITVRPGRRLITATPACMALPYFARLMKEACVYRARVKAYSFHADGEYVARCPVCSRQFHRHSPPKQEHKCGACLAPLDFK